jgi:hypothetical protein
MTDKSLKQQSLNWDKEESLKNTYLKILLQLVLMRVILESQSQDKLPLEWVSI